MAGILGVAALGITACTGHLTGAERVIERVEVVTAPAPTPLVIEKVIEHRVEVPVVETIEVPGPTATVEVPTGLTQADVDAGYAAGDADGRAEGEQPPPDAAPQDGGAIDPANLATALATPCASEDSANCYWDAATMGNGVGDSFVTVEGHMFPFPGRG